MLSGAICLCIHVHFLVQVSYRGFFYGHTPLRVNQQMDDRGPKIVTLFRDPRKRAVSAWNHAKHTHHLGTKNAESMFPNSRNELENSTLTVRDFAKHKHVQACQSKMLVGGQVCSLFIFQKYDLIFLWTITL